jgi:glycerophosphoryl diester phosphodiesterase
MTPSGSVFHERKTPVIFGHRGASAHAPENTLAAFELAAEHGADAIELDAKLTADGEVVVIHDQTTDRTTGVPGRVMQLSLASLKELDAGSYFGESFKGEKIPTLAEVFEAIGRRLYINIELTNYSSLTDALPETSARLVQVHGLEDAVMFSSFNPLALVRVRRYLPSAQLGLLTIPGRAGGLFRSPLGRLIPHQALHPEKDDISRELIERVHRSGRQINAWTVNDPDTIRKLASWHIDGIITDDPALAKKTLAETRI